MNGNQEVGGVERGDFEMGAIPSSTVAISEIIYVGRASFRVAHEFESPPSPAVETTAWFRAVEADPRRTATLSSGPGWILAAPSDDEGAPILYDSEVLGPAPKRPRAWPWTIGLPLAFGGFLCGIVMSPLVSTSASEPRNAAALTVAPPAVARPVVARPVVARPVVAMIAPVVSAGLSAELPPELPPGSSPASSPVASPALAPAPGSGPIVAPLGGPEVPAPRVTVVAEKVPNRLTTRPGLPVQGRAAAKSGIRKSVPRRPARIASSANDPTTQAAQRPWVDPWAEN